MSDLLRLLQMLQQGGQSTPQSDFPAPLHPRIMEQRNMLRGDPYAEAIFQQAYGGQDNTGDAPQMEQPAHPNVERFAGGMMQAIGDTNYRPRNFGEGLLLGGLHGAGGAIMGKAGEREAGNAEKKAAYKAEQKAAFEQKALAQKQYGDMALKTREDASKPKPQTLEEKLAEQAALITGRIVATDKAYKDNNIPRYKPTDDVMPLSPEADAFMANVWAGGGSLPPRGLLTNPQGVRIVEQAASIPGADPVAARADVVSNQAALTNTTKMIHAANAFGKNAEYNFNIMLKRVKAVPDTKIPYMNTPIRELANKAGGSAEVAAYRTALATVQPEFARLLKNPNLTGVLTDTASSEMQKIIDGSYSLNQMMAVFDVLKQEKNNRIKSLEEEREVIRKAMKNPFLNGGSGSTPGAAPVGGGNKVQWGLDDNGNPVKLGGQ